MLGALWGRVREAAFALPERLDAFDVGARAVTWAALFLLAWSFSVLGGFMATLGGVTGRDVPGYHDWNNLLGRLGGLAYDQALGRLTHRLGAALIVLALVWGIRLLLQQRRALRTSAV